ncbi:MAG: hypothetical protein GX857_02030 [Bacteroidales bacterium]|jgi:hypothetical protein|nr:hypothetical protein [Bacteroidales bacterium]
MNKNKIISGTIGVLIGYTLFILLIDFLSKPINIPLAFKPIESMQTYFFSFVFTMGAVGWILGSLLLIAVLTLFYFIGVWVYNLIFKNVR